MSNLKKWAAGSAIALATVAMPVGVALATASPSPSPSVCTTNNGATSFTVANGVATAHIHLSGSENCQLTVSMASWQTTALHDPANDKTYQSDFYKTQKLYDSATKTFTGAGNVTMSVKVPDCFYQVDLVRGASATGTYPGGAAGGPLYPKGAMIHSLHGGTKACGGNGGGTPTPTPSVLGATTLPDTGASDFASLGLASLVSAGAYAVARRRATR